jgi:hypothetical protein
MLQFRIIETAKKYPSVLLHRNRDEDGVETVEIKAIGIMDGQEDMFAEESITFSCYHSACRFIEDFSKESAEQWCEKESITIW